MDVNKARDLFNKLNIPHANFPGKIVLEVAEYHLKEREAVFLEGLDVHPQKEEIISILTSLCVNDRGITYYLINAQGEVVNYDWEKGIYVDGPVRNDIKYKNTFSEKELEFMSIDPSNYYKLAANHGWEKYIDGGYFDIDALKSVRVSR